MAVSSYNHMDKDTINKLNILLFVTNTKICVHFTRLGISLAKTGHKVVLISDDKRATETFSDELKRYGVKHYSIEEISRKSLNGVMELRRIFQKDGINEFKRKV